MTPEEEVKMLNDDHAIWKQSQKHVHRSFAANITQIPGIDISGQLTDIMTRFCANEDVYRNDTSFEYAAPLYLDKAKGIILCTTDDTLAKLWVSQINELLSKNKIAAVEELKDASRSKDSFNDNMFRIDYARCVDSYIDQISGEYDDEISGMHYIGIVVTNYNGERRNHKEHAKACENAFDQLNSILEVEQ